MEDRELIRTRREIGARLRSRRKELLLTQCELATSLGHKGSTRINQIELGRQRLYAEELPRICKKLNCTYSDIIGTGDDDEE